MANEFNKNQQQDPQQKRNQGQEQGLNQGQSSSYDPGTGQYAGFEQEKS